jgi:hypothetical protein
MLLSKAYLRQNMSFMLCGRTCEAQATSRFFVSTSSTRQTTKTLEKAHIEAREKTCGGLDI